jgi:hypothetical protein
MSDGLPTPRSMLRTGRVRVLPTSNADLQRLILAVRGDVLLRDLRFRCTSCRSRLTDFAAPAGAT